MPTVLVKGAEHRLRTGARAKSKDDPRTIDQWMADAACELLLAGTGAPIVERTPGGVEIEHAGLLATIRPVVQVTIPVTTICRFPGCAAIARLDDVDHTIAWEDGGTTSLGNLAHLCRRHHTLKHATPWTVTQPTLGELHWRSPLGTDSVDRPPATGPAFVDAGQDPDGLPPPDALPC